MDGMVRVWMPDRKFVKGLKVGDEVENCFGKMAEVVSIHCKNTDVNGRAYVCYHTRLSENATMSGTLKEGELHRTVANTSLLNSWQLDRTEEWMRQSGVDEFWLGHGISYGDALKMDADGRWVVNVDWTREGKNPNTEKVETRTIQELGEADLRKQGFRLIREEQAWGHCPSYWHPLRDAMRFVENGIVMHPTDMAAELKRSWKSRMGTESEAQYRRCLKELKELARRESG